MDPYVLSYILLLFAMIFSLYAQIKVNTTFSKFSKRSNRRGLTGAQVARMILDSKGLYSVTVEHVHGNLSDHYDPRSNTVRLSDSVYGSTSVAALGVAAHECGHAIQHAEQYTPVVIRSSIVKLTSICSYLSFILIFVGIIIDAMSAMAGSLGYLFQLAGIVAFAVVTFFQLVTLPTEFNASKRALVILRGDGILAKEEISGAKSVLTAAALTYLAALAVSLLQLLRLILIVTGGNRRR
jgi:Zn-dependent membrane protease YugP